MHTPGHNPFQTITEQPYGLTEYEYQGISPEIIQALQGVFDFGDLAGFSGVAGGEPVGINVLEEVYGISDSALGLTDIFDSESLANALSQIGGILGPAALKPGEIQALTPEMLEKTTSAYYNPYEEAKRETLVEKLGKNIAGAQTGGFAGSGARQSGLSAAERMYGSGYGDLLSDIMKMKAGAQEDVLDSIYGWAETLAEAQP